MKRVCIALIVLLIAAEPTQPQSRRSGYSSGSPSSCFREITIRHGDSASMWVTAYYPLHSYCDLPPQQIDYTMFTHLILFTAEPTSTPPYFNLVDGSTDSATLETGVPGWCYNRASNNNSNGLTHLSILRDSCTSNGVKLLLCLGGDWGYKASRFQKMVEDTVKQEMFIASALGYAKRRGFDGIDIDWEYPVPSTREQFSRFLRRVRTELDLWKPRGILTLAVGPEVRTDLIDPMVANAVVDQINIMNYGMGEGAYSGYNAPLRRPKFPHYDSWTISDHGAMQYIQQGFRAEKLGMILPYEAKRWKNIDGPGQLKESNPIVVSNDEVFQKLRQHRQAYHWDDVAEVPWAGITERDVKYFYSYDDSASIAVKVNWARSLHLGGVGVWELWREKIDAADGGDRPARAFSLAQNYPNPFNPKTIIEYSLAEAAQVEIEVFNLIGQRVAGLLHETQEGGIYAIEWDARDQKGNTLPSGVYYYRITVTPIKPSEETFSQVKRMVVMK